MPQESIDFSQIYLVEGTVEQDPMTDQFTIHTVDPAGKAFSFDPNAALGRYKGQEVRLVIAPLVDIAKVEKLVQEQAASGEDAFVVEPMLPKGGGGEA